MDIRKNTVKPFNKLSCTQRKREKSEKLLKNFLGGLIFYPRKLFGKRARMKSEKIIVLARIVRGMLMAKERKIKHDSGSNSTIPAKDFPAISINK